jgi:hypothetical protein
MYRPVLFTATALVALSTSVHLAVLHAAGSPMNNHRQMSKPKKAKILYNQNSDYANASISSMNITSSAFDDQAADDFIVPNGKSWVVTEVDVSGVYFDGSGPATSENVIFYRSRNGLPGKAIAKGTFNYLQGVDDHGTFAIALPNGGLRLKAGHYWVSVVANISVIEAGGWSWKINATQHDDQATWQNPQGGYGVCPSWNTLEYCVSQAGDLMFELKGTFR